MDIYRWPTGLATNLKLTGQVAVRNVLNDFKTNAAMLALSAPPIDEREATTATYGPVGNP